MAKDTGGFAFPSGDFVNKEPVDGMTLRDYFAAKAMQGAMAGRVAWPFDDFHKQECAAECYKLADAMLAERSK